MKYALTTALLIFSLNSNSSLSRDHCVELRSMKESLHDHLRVEEWDNFLNRLKKLPNEYKESYELSENLEKTIRAIETIVSNLEADNKSFFNLPQPQITGKGMYINSVFNSIIQEMCD